MKIVLIGFATSYKSTVGKALAKKLNIEFCDVDHLVEKNAGKTIQQIFATNGEKSFREMERQALLQLAQKQNCVVSCGGGSVISDAFAMLKQNAIVLWLKVDGKCVYKRLNGKTRPLFDNLSLDELCKKVAERNELYQPLCDVMVDTTNLSSQQVVDQVMEKLQL